MEENEEILDENLKGLAFALAFLMVVPKIVSAAETSQMIATSNSIPQLQTTYTKSFPRQKDDLGYNAAQIINILSWTLWEEARNQSKEGIEAVAAVIWNRANGDAAKLTSVVFARKQFSCWNKASPLTNPVYSPKNYSIVFPKEASVNKRTMTAWRNCVDCAKRMYSGEFKPAKGLEKANSYARISVADKWTDMKNVVTIGSHKFGTRQLRRTN